jgi:MFS family permease
MGSVALNPVSGLLGELNWHWSFAIYGLAAPFAALAVVALQGRLPRAPQPKTEVVPLLRWFPFRFAIIGLLLGIVIYVPAVYLPFLLRDLGMTSPALISFVLTGDIIAGAIAALCYGPARRVLSEHGAFMVSVGFAGLGLLIAAWAPSYLFVIIGSVIFGIGVAWFFPNIMIFVASRVRSDQQGRAAGLVKGATYLGSPLAVVVSEPIARGYGASGAIALAGLLSLSLLATAIVHRLRRDRRAALSAQSAA